MKTLISLIFFISFCIPASAQNVSINKGQGFRVEKLDGKVLIISFTTNLENLSSKGVGVTIKKGQLFKDGENLGSFKLVKKIKLRSRSKENIDVRVKVDLAKDLNILKEGLQALKGKQVEIKVTGTFKTTWFIFSKKYPFDYSETIPMKNLFGNIKLW